MSVPGEDSENDFARDVIARYIDKIYPNVTLINVSPDGTLLSTSTDTEHDHLLAVLCSPLDTMPVEWAARAIPRAKLIEVERLANACDLVSYADSTSDLQKTAVFKYQWDGKWGGSAWDELNYWIRVSGHPNIVPIDRIVTDHYELPVLGHKEVVVGFTSKFISGGNLRDHRNRLFKLKHLKQLLRVIDDLNLRYGIAHQDLATYNMFIDPSSDCLQIFDFDYAARIGQKPPEPRHPEYYNGSRYDETLDDVKGAAFALYEILTGDLQHRIFEPGSNISDVLDKEWVQHPEVRLDCDLLEYRTALCEWIRWRERPENMISHYTEAPEYIDWPMPYVPVMPEQYGDQNEPEMKPCAFSTRAGWKSMGVDIIEWKRLARNKIPDGFCVLGNGELVLKSELDFDYESDLSSRTSNSGATDVGGGS